MALVASEAHFAEEVARARQRRRSRSAAHVDVLGAT